MRRIFFGLYTIFLPQVDGFHTSYVSLQSSPLPTTHAVAKVEWEAESFSSGWIADNGAASR